MVVVPGVMSRVELLTSNQPFAGRSLFLPCKIAVTPVAGMFDNANDISGFIKVFVERKPGFAWIVRSEITPFENLNRYSAFPT